MNRRAPLTLAAAAMLAAAPAFGQQPSSPDARRAAVLGVQPGSTVLLRLTTREMFSGRLLEATADTLTVALSDTTRHIAVAGLESLSERRGNARRGLLIGGAAGLVVGTLLGLVIADAVCEGASDCNKFGPAAKTVAISVAVLGGGGALIGQLTPEWRQRYP